MNINLKSGITKIWSGKHFLIDEDSLRRFQGIFENAGKEISTETKVVFSVFREDHRFYETVTIEEVLSDPNSTKHKIDQFRIELRDTTPDRDLPPWERDYIAYVSFYENNIEFRIAYKDRNWALLLADQLEIQIDRVLKTQIIPSYLLILFVLSIGALLYALSNRIEQLNEVREIINWGIIALVVFGIYSVSHEISFSDKRHKVVERICGPKSFFLWGDEVEKHQKYSNRMNGFQWGVIVATIVSFGANITTGFFDKPNKPIENREPKPQLTDKDTLGKIDLTDSIEIKNKSQKQPKSKQ